MALSLVANNSFDQFMKMFSPPKAAEDSPRMDETDDELKKGLGFSDKDIAKAIAATPAPQNRGPAGDVMKGLGFSDKDIAKAIAATPSVKVDYSTPQGAAAANAAVSSEPGSSESLFDIMRKARKAESSNSTAAAPTARASRTALARGAPSGVEESREFARGLFAISQMAQQELDRYRKANPKADANDPRLKSLQDAATAAGEDAQAGVKWATMTTSARQSVLTREDMDAQRERTKLMTGSYQDEVTGQAFEQRSRKDLLKAQGMPEAQADYAAAQGNLLEAGKYYNETGVMRGGAGVGTSTTRAGGVISAPDASGNRTLTSPYGKGSVTYLTPEQMKNRPEAIMDGKPASQLFDEAAMRQGRTFTVGDATYSPEMSPADRAQKDLDEQKRKAEEERKKGFAASMIKK